MSGKTKAQLLDELKNTKQKLSEALSDIAECERIEKSHIRRISDYRELITQKDVTMMEKAERIGNLEARLSALFDHKAELSRKNETLQKELNTATSEAKFLSDEYNKVVCGSVWSFIRLKFNMWADDVRKSIDIEPEEG